MSAHSLSYNLLNLSKLRKGVEKKVGQNEPIKYWLCCCFFCCCFCLVLRSERVWADEGLPSPAFNKYMAILLCIIQPSEETCTYICICTTVVAWRRRLRSSPFVFFIYIYLFISAQEGKVRILHDRSRATIRAQRRLCLSFSRRGGGDPSANRFSNSSQPASPQSQFTLHRLPALSYGYFWFCLFKWRFKEINVLLSKTCVYYFGSGLIILVVQYIMLYKI